jgi:tetratricopeptide (TPR) repeat protein
MKTQFVILLLFALICLRSLAGEIFTPEVCQQVTERYEKHPESFPDEQLMSVAMCYGILKKSDKAVPIFVRHLKLEPNDENALRLLGTIYVLGFQGRDKFDEGAKLLRKAWSLGDSDSLNILAGACLKSVRYKEMRDLIPDMLAQRTKDTELVEMLVVYSLRTEPPDKPLFKNVVGELDDAGVFQHKSVINLVLDGLEKCGETNRAAALREKLSHWPKDDIDPKDLTPERLRQTIQEYEKDPKIWPETNLLRVAIAYATAGKFDLARPIYDRILTIKPDYPRALRGLGIVLVFQERFPEAVQPLRKAWYYGDIDALSPLALTYLAIGKIDEMRDLIPSLLKHKGESIDLVKWLISYSLKADPPDKEMFLKAIIGLTDEVILRREDATMFMIKGLEKFGFDARARLLKTKAKELGMMKGSSKDVLD